MKNSLLFRSVRPERGRNARGLVRYGAARSNSEQAAPSACVGKRYSVAQMVWNKSTRRAGDRGGARAGRPRWVRILAITGGSSMTAQSAVKFTTLLKR